MKVLVIYSHSYHDTSHAGKVILDVFKAQPDFEVRNLEEIYPNCAPIDIALEQQRLAEATSSSSTIHLLVQHACRPQALYG